MSEYLSINPENPQPKSRKPGSMLETAIYRAGGYRAYRRTKEAMRSTLEKTQRVTFNHEGRPVVYWAGLSIPPLTSEGKQRLRLEYRRNVLQKWPEAAYVHTAAWLRAPGLIDDVLLCSLIGGIPRFAYDEAGMTEREVTELQNDHVRIYQHGCALMQVHVQPFDPKRKVYKGEQYITMTESENITHVCTVQSVYGEFPHDAEYAAEILACITETDTMRDLMQPDAIVQGICMRAQAALNE